jgi:hypothetical protein
MLALALLGLATVGGCASSSSPSEVASTADSEQAGLQDAADPTPTLLPRSYGIPTDPISVTTSAAGTVVPPSNIYNPPVASSVVVVPPPYIVSSVQGYPRPPTSSVVAVPPPTIVSSVQGSARPSSVVAVPPPSIISSVQGSAPPSSVVAIPPPSIVSSVQGSAAPSSAVWSGQPTSQAAPSQWTSSAQAPAPPSSVQPPALPSSAAPSSPPIATSVVSIPPPSIVSSVQASVPPSSIQAPVPSSSAAWSSQSSSQAGSSAVVPSRTASSIQGSSAAFSSAAPSSAALTSWVGGSSVAPSSGSSVKPSGSSSAAQSSAQGSSAAQSFGSAAPSSKPTSDQTSTTAEGVIVIPTGISGSSTLSGSILFPPEFSGSTTPGPSKSSTLSAFLPLPIMTGSSSTPPNPMPTSTGCPDECRALGWCKGYCENWLFPQPPDKQPPPECMDPANMDWCMFWWHGSPATKTSSSSNPMPTSKGCPDQCRVLGWCQGYCENWLFPQPPENPPPPECMDPANMNWCMLWWQGPPKTTTTSSSSSPVPTATGCPEECRPLKWCEGYCKDMIFPRPIDEEPPHECLDPKNLAWCHPWWFGPDDSEGGGARHPGDPDSHSDSDPNCKEDNCIATCALQRIASFFLLKRPLCLCIPHKCDKGDDSDSKSDSDSMSDSDDDNDHDNHNGVKPPKPPKPKPTSFPKPTIKCKILGCGCGYMGLGWGPGCPGLDDIELNVSCGIFGCDPCIFFGCPGGTRPTGIIGHDGYCPGPTGCDPCDPALCSRPGCTIPGGCGPKPGPAPTRPADEVDPDECDDNMRTTITDRFVMCTEGFDVSKLPSSLRVIGSTKSSWTGGSTSSTMITSVCMPMIDFTRTICGPAHGYDTTTTLTKTNTLTSDDGPACTRAPLSLDDDEGNNNPDEPKNSWTFSSMTLSAPSSKSKSSSKSSSKTSSSSSSATPAPSHTPMDRNGHWTAEMQQFMYDDYTEIHWDLYDPNGFHAGAHTVRGHNKLKEITDYIQSVNRPYGDSMPFGVDLTLIERK